MLENLKSHLINILGWRTNRKIVVFESDDWGSIRMPSKKVYDIVSEKGYPVDHCAYCRNDSLESNEDLEKIGEVLLSVKDKNGNPAKFTINNIVANPDFNAIRENNFKEYVYEPFTKTLAKYPGRGKVMDLYRQGIEEQIFRPQFHGREHVNVNRWMEALQNGNKRFRDAFDHSMLTLPAGRHSNGRKDYLDSFGLSYHKQYESEEKIIADGMRLFKEQWGFSSQTFIAPCYTWPSEIEPHLVSQGIRGIQGTHVQRVPDSGNDLSIKKKYHYTGQKNRHGQRYLVRNVFFELIEYGNNNAVEKAMEQITRAFVYKKPAVISSHRVNYMGEIREVNRNKNIRLLGKLLKAIKHKFPDTEFMSSDELLKVMVN